MTGLLLAVMLAERTVFPISGAVFRGHDGGRAEAQPDGSAIVTLTAGARWTGARLELPQDLRAAEWSEILFDVENLSDRLVPVSVKLMAVGNGPVSERVLLPARTRRVFTVPIAAKIAKVPFPIEGTNDITGEKKRSADLIDEVRWFDFFERDSPGGVKLKVRRVVFRGGSRRPVYGTDAAGFLPILDGYGEFRHADWPTKVRCDADLAKFRAEEEKFLSRPDAPADALDRFGGTLNGPQLEATGHFRTEKVEGRWWLVTPEGHLFFSYGITGVRPPPVHPIRGRESYFTPAVEPVKGAYPYAERNLRIKYGADFSWDFMADLYVKRLICWGFNTIANWSDRRVIAKRRLPYVLPLATHRGGARMITVRGDRRRIVDVFDPAFERCFRREAETAAKTGAADPWCIGWFVDNEYPWGDRDDYACLADAVRAAPDDQPAKRELAGCANDREFVNRFAERYFSTIRRVMKEVAPRKLYLGQRFAREGLLHAPMDVWRVAVKYCDVISFNLYGLLPEIDMPEEVRSKPTLACEFSFGALDRGFLYTGLVGCADQSERAERFMAYVRAALKDPNLVGVHWFQFHDQPVTGRAQDGECGEYGFVDVCDTPYPEMVGAARLMAREIYRKEGK